MKHKLLLLWSWFVRTALFFLPDIPCVMRFRGWLYGWGMQRCGKNFQVTHDAVIKDLENISVGDHCFVGSHVMILGSGKINIEGEVQLAPHAVLISGDHSPVDGSYRFGRSIIGEINIGFGSWVAANCTITKGGGLPPSSVLAANSVLTKSYTTSRAIYGGIPAKLIKEIVD